jgi:hypothetical protein
MNEWLGEALQKKEHELAEVICVLEAQDEGIKRLKAAPVVAPPLTPELRRELCEELNARWDTGDNFGRIVDRAWDYFQRITSSLARTIGPGEVVVPAEEWRIYREWENEARANGRDHIRFAELLRLDALDALRTQATTNKEQPE